MELAFIFLRNIFGYILMMGILISIHEYGHFITAKKLGIKILVFSIGFGKPLWSRVSKEGIKYQIGMIPLGGYVSMLNETDDNIESLSEEDKKRAFSQQPNWKRALVVAAGPVFNIVLGFVLYWGLFIWGIPDLKPEINQPSPGSYLQAAGLQKGDLITRIGGEEVEGFNQVTMLFVDKLLDTGKTTITVNRQGKPLEMTMDIGSPLKLNGSTNLPELLGLEPNVDVQLLAWIGDIAKDSPAQLAGLQTGDKVINIDGHAVKTWDEMSKHIQATKEGAAIEMQVERKGEQVSLMVKPYFNTEHKRQIIGVGVAKEAQKMIAEALEPLKITAQYDVITSAKVALKNTLNASLLIFKVVGKMLTGNINISAMSGPITMADIAGQVLASGLAAFIGLLAVFSINIGIMNLLPVPVLDGGHLLGYIIKGIIGKDRIPPALGTWVLKIGAVMLMLFMATVVFNDFDKYLGLKNIFFSIISHLGIQ